MKTLKIIFVPSIKLEGLYQRPQQIASRLSTKFTILWIDQPTFFLKALLKALLGEFRLKEHIIDNLYMLRTFTFIPFSRVRIVQIINEIVWLFLIKFYGIIFFRKMRDTILFVCHPLFMFPFKNGLLVYDRCDRYGKYKDIKFMMLKRQVDDIKFMKKATLVINSSYNLYKESLSYNKNSVLIRNGADLSHFKKTWSLTKETNKKVIGYHGAVASWVDFRLLQKLAETYPEYELHIIGPSAAGVDKNQDYMILRRTKNVKIFGRISYDKLPTYLKEFDIGIVPFVLDELTEAVDPIKVYEYMAAGKPVVTTNLPELHRLKDYIYIAKDHDDFIRLCKQAVEKPKVTPEELIKNANENTWERRAEQIETEIRKMVS